MLDLDKLLIIMFNPSFPLVYVRLFQELKIILVMFHDLRKLRAWQTDRLCKIVFRIIGCQKAPAVGSFLSITKIKIILPDKAWFLT